MEIVLQNIGKQFKNGTRALDHVTFTIPQGEFVSVIGPSGAGKTTLFRILNGMETPGDGAVLFDGGDHCIFYRNRKETGAGKESERETISRLFHVCSTML